MKVLLVIMALGGYNGNSPSFTTQEMPNAEVCTAVAEQVVIKFKSMPYGWGEIGRDGPRVLRVECIPY